MSAPPPSGTERRPALDGVRAVAVLAVLAYHVGTRTQGGFLGVDVFFVLSGYLITSLLLEERARTGRIHLSRFWARRARRLFPALLVLIVAVVVVIAAQGHVEDYAVRRSDLVSTLFYVANWHFIAVDQSYFAQFASISPLEHMWSLSIEEQFYVFWPLLVLVLTRLARGRSWVLGAVVAAAAVASAVLMAVIHTPTNPTRAYIGTDTRAQELLIGALLAVAVFARLVAIGRAARAARLLGPAAAVAVLAALFAIDDQAAFYYHGGALLFSLAVAGALWSVETQPRAGLGRVLSVRPLVWVGTISYGLYLWHWPFVQWFDDPDVVSGRSRQLAVLAATFAAATLSYYLVERPVRRGQLPWVGFSARRLAVVTPLAFAAVAALALSVVHVEPRSLAAQVSDVSVTYCPEDAHQPVKGYRWCERVAGSSDFTVATAGDSTAAALDPGLRAVARERGWQYVQASINGCSIVPIAFPSNFDDPASVAEARRCLDGVDGLLDDVTRTVHPDLWVVSDRWMLGPAVADDDERRESDEPALQDEIRARLRERLSHLADDAQVVMVLPTGGGPPIECAEDDSSDPRCGSEETTMASPAVVRGREAIADAARGLGDRVVLVDEAQRVCPDGRCPVAIDGTLVRYDTVHYTATFSRLIVPHILDDAQDAGLRLG